MNYYLQQFAATAAPSVWAGLKAQDTRIPWEPITERLPRQAGASRDGVEQQGQQLALGGGDPSSGTISSSPPACSRAVPPSALAGSSRRSRTRSSSSWRSRTRTVTGSRRPPTRSPGGRRPVVTTPLFALTNKVPGRVPARLDRPSLRAGARALVEKTEALAAAIRYLATAGQAPASRSERAGSRRRSSKQALAAANKLVQSNCGARTSVVESTDPGPYAPDLPAMKTIGTDGALHVGAHAGPWAPLPGRPAADHSAHRLRSSDRARPGATTGTATAEAGSDGGWRAVHQAQRLRPRWLRRSFRSRSRPSASARPARTLLLGAGLLPPAAEPVRRLLAQGGAHDAPGAPTDVEEQDETIDGDARGRGASEAGRPSRRGSDRSRSRCSACSRWCSSLRSSPARSSGSGTATASTSSPPT